MSAFCTLRPVTAPHPFAGLAGLLDDPRYATNSARVANRQLVTDTLVPVMAGDTTANWIARLEAISVGCGPINTLAQVFADPQVIARNSVVRVPHATAPDGVQVIANPVRLSETPVDYRRGPPLLGQHTDEVLGGLGLSATELAGLRERRVI